MARDAMIVSDTQPLLTPDLRAASNSIFVLRSVEEVRHDALARIAGPLEIIHRHDFSHPRATQKHGMVISIAVRPLHDHLVLLSFDRLRHVEKVNVVRVLHASRRCQADRSRSTGGDHRPLALQTLCNVLARLSLEIVETHWMQRCLLHRSQYLWWHAGSCQSRIGSRGVDDLLHAKLCVVVLARTRCGPGRGFG